MRPAPLLCLLLIALTAIPAAAGPLDETRYCGEPPRDGRGRILRRSDVLDAFQRLYPCPATGERTGACPGWAKDHVIPLAVGGCDAVSNLQWLPLTIKSCMGKRCKDRWEREVYKSAVPAKP